MFFRQLLNDRTACASYLLGCATHRQFAVVEPHIDHVDDYINLHAHGERTVDEMARLLYRSLTEKLLALPDHLLLYPSHYSGSVCGRGLSATPVSTIGFERRHNPALQFASDEEFVQALLTDIPPAPEQQATIVPANRSGRPLAEVA